METAKSSVSGESEISLKEAVIGIDLGTTNTCAAVQLDKQPELFSLGGDKALLASVVYIEYAEYCKTEMPMSLQEEFLRFTDTDKPTTVVIGESAKSMPKREKIIFQSKLYIGRKLKDEAVQEIIERHPFKVVEGQQGYAAFEIDGRIHSPEFIASLLLQKVKEVADTRLESLGIAPVRRAVIGVPAYFDQTRREFTWIAAQFAGFDNEVKLITEPCAAGVHYKLNMGGVETRILVADIGGGTTDITHVEDDEVMAELRVHTVMGDNQLGGEDFTAVIEKIIEKKWREGQPDSVELNAKSKSNMHKSAETAKLVLCDSPTTSFDCTINKVEDSYTITAEEFAEGSGPLLEQILGLIRDVKEKSADEWEKIQCILLMGGGALLPLIQDLLANSSEIGKRVSKSLLASASVMTAVAGGCAAFAVPMSDIELRPEGMKHRLLIEATPYNLGVEDSQGKMRVLIKRHTAIPSEKVWDENFSFPRNNRLVTGYEDALKIKVLEGNEEMAKDNNTLAERVFQRKERPAGYSSRTRAYISQADRQKAEREQAVKIGFRVDRNMRLQVEACMLVTGEQCELRVDTSGSVLMKKVDDNEPTMTVDTAAQKRTLDSIDAILSSQGTSKKGRND